MTSGKAQRRGRRRIGTVAFVLAPGLLVGGGLWAASAPLQELMGGAVPKPCVPQVVRGPSPTTITVNVYNHGAAQGAAGKVAKQLPLRDFRLGQVGNDPSLSAVKGVGEIRYGPQGLDQALVAQKLLLPEAALVKDYRFGTSVDLVLAQGFSVLAPPIRPMVRRAEVKVNVYNTTYHAGLAKKTARALADVGFAAGKVGTDPKNTWVTDTAVVRHGPDGDLAAALVQAVVPTSRLVLDRSISGTSVDLLIGMTSQGVLDRVPPEPPKTPPTPLRVARPCR